MNRQKQNSRKEAFKATLDTSAARTRRGSQTSLLRKSKREESLMKRRNATASPLKPMSSVAGPMALAAAAADADGGKSKAELTAAALAQVAAPEALLAALHGDSPAAALEATQALRRALSIEKAPPIDDVIALGVLPRLVQFLQCAAEQPQLAFEAAWALTNIASGTSAHTHAVVDAGAVPVFVHLLADGDEPLRDQCVWALGNVAGDGAALRDLCIEAHVLEALLHQFTLSPSIALVRNATWALSNLCRGKPAPPFASVQGAVPALAHLVRSEDRETAVDAAWALSYLTDGDDSKIEAVVSAQVAEPLVKLLAHPERVVQTPALRAVGNIVTGTSSQTQAIIEQGPFASLINLLDSPKKSIVKETCWTVSNITAGEQHQIQAVIESGIMPLLAQKLLKAEFDIKKEACWAISNATTGGTPEQTRSFVDEATIQGLVSIAGSSDSKIALVALEALENILNAGVDCGDNGDNLYIDWFEQVDGIDLLEDLQEHQNEAIYKRAVGMLETFFDADEQAADENLAPTLAAPKTVGAPLATPPTFAFGMQMANANAGAGMGVGVNPSSPFAF